MKILHISAKNPMDGNSGIPAVLKGLTSEQNRIEGVESRVLSLCASVESVESQYFDYVNKSKWEMYIKSYAPDFAIFHSFYHYEYAQVVKILRREHIPFALEPHGSFGHSALMKSRIKKIVADRTVFRSLLKNATAYIYTIEAERKDSAYHCENMLLIPNGAYECEVESAASKKETTTPVYYFLGRYDINHKGLDYLMNSLKILDERKESITIYLYGIGNDEQNKYVRDSIRGFKHVTACDKGTIYGDSKKHALEDANILVLTSRYEGSPITILDALTYGNPCVVTPGTNVLDELIDNNIGWGCELNAESIANAIILARQEYIKDIHGYERRCKDYVIAHYSWKQIAKLSVEQYAEILKNKR